MTVTSKRLSLGAVLVAFVASVPLAAQTTAGTDTEIQTPVVLSSQKQSMIREHFKRSNFPVANLSEPVRVDMVVPPEVDLIALPQDAGTEVPTTTNYHFLVASDVIAVVIPESRKVIQLIKR